jgi:8-oxo-dGTP diphosphatase
MADKTAQDEQARVGVGALIFRDGKVLWGKRKGSFGAGMYGFVGGHLEHGETAEQAIVREISEECGLKVKNLRVLCVSDFLTFYPKHYLDIGFLADWDSGEPQVLEPHKLEVWEWRAIDDMPEDVFPPCRGYLEAYKSGKNYFTYPAANTTAVS